MGFPKDVTHSLTIPFYTAMNCIILNATTDLLHAVVQLVPLLDDFCREELGATDALASAVTCRDEETSWNPGIANPPCPLGWSCSND